MASNRRGGKSVVTWRLELSRPAVAALRALPREERRRVARRLEHLEESGLPPGAAAGEPTQVPAGDQVLTCVAEPESGRIVVVTLLPQHAPAARAAQRMTRRWMRVLLGGEGMERVVKDIGYAARTLARAPGFTAAAVLALALGIGASTAVFSVASGVLLKPLPYGNAARNVAIWASWTDFPKTWVSDPEYVYWYQNNRTLEDLALYFTSTHTFTSPDDPELVGSGVVTPNTFDVLGVQPLLGRTFTWDEALAEEPVVMLGYEAWQRRYGGDPSIVGTDVEINGRPFTVVGVLPRGFVLPLDYASASPSEVFFAGPVDREAPVTVPGNGGSHGYYTVGLLRDGVSVEEARADIQGLSARLESEGVYQESWHFEPLVIDLQEDIVGSARTTLYFLLAACGFLLLIACGNVANLMLSRAEARSRDVAVRRALGAGRGHILRQLSAESVLLSVVGGALGLLLARVGVDTLLRINPEAFPRAGGVDLDGSAVLFAAVLSLVTPLLFGWIPALRVFRAGPASALHDAGRGAAANARANRTQGLLVSGQMAMAVVLLALSSLTMRTFVQLTRVELGFQAENVLTFGVTVPSLSYPNAEDVSGFYDELVRRIEEVPGVRSAAAVRLLPLASQMGDSGFRPVGHEPAPGESTAADWQWATPGYLELMGIPLKEGRFLEEGDRADGQEVVVVNETLARRWWGEDSPIGTRVRAGGGDTAVVVGVVGDIRHNGVTADIKGRFYRPLSQVQWIGTMRRMSLTVQAQDDPTSLVQPIREVLRGMDARMPMSAVRTVDEIVDASLAQPRFAMVLMGVFAVLALTLAVVGIYGVIAYAVSRRTQEIGVRMALGAEPGAVVGMVVRQGMVMAVLGVAAGTATALGVTRFMESMLYDVGAQDLVTFATVPAVFVLVALAACWVPAARAARIPPTTALRTE